MLSRAHLLAYLAASLVLSALGLTDDEGALRQNLIETGIAIMLLGGLVWAAAKAPRSKFRQADLAQLAMTYTGLALVLGILTR